MTDLEDTLDSQMARFAPRRPAQGAAPAAPIKAPVPADAPAASPAPGTVPAAPSTTSGRPVSQPPAAPPAAPAADLPEHESSPEDEANIVAFLPREASGKRIMNAIMKEVEKWAAPATLSRSEERQFRQMAAQSRVLNVIDTLGKYNLGKFFIGAKETLKHGDWIRYLEACDMPRRTAFKYMAIAIAFPDHTVVRNFGFNFCYDVAALDLPAEVLSQIHAAHDRTEAEGILAAWDETQTINAAWLGLHDSPTTAFGSSLALALSRPPFVREFRAMVAPLPRDQVDLVVDRYKQLIPQFDDGQAVVRYLQGQPQNSAPVASATPESESSEPQLADVFRLKSFHTRLDALASSEGLPLDQEAKALAREIETKLLDLTRMLQERAAR